MQGGTCGTENCDGRGLMYSAWPIRVGWVAGSGWMPIWLTNGDQLRSAHAEPGSQSNQPWSACVTCGSSVKNVFWIWSLRPGCSKVSWDLWNRSISQTYFTHSAPILAPRNQPSTVNKQWPSLRESHMSHHTRFNPAEKRKLPRCTVYFLVQIQFTGRYNHQSESDFVFLLCRKCQNLSYLIYNSRICHREAHATLVKPGRACATIFLLPVKPRHGLADFNTHCCDLSLAWCRCV